MIRARLVKNNDWLDSDFSHFGYFDEEALHQKKFITTVIERLKPSRALDNWDNNMSFSLLLLIFKR